MGKLFAGAFCLQSNTGICLVKHTYDLCDDIYTFTPTIIQPIYSAGSSKSPQELCHHIHWELLQRELPQDRHGQRDCRVHMGSWNKDGQNVVTNPNSATIITESSDVS